MCIKDFLEHCGWVFCFLLLLPENKILITDFSVVSGLVPKCESKVATDDAETGGQIRGEVLEFGEHGRHGHVPPRSRFLAGKHPVARPPQPTFPATARKSLFTGLFVSFTEFCAVSRENAICDMTLLSAFCTNSDDNLYL